MGKTYPTYDKLLWLYIASMFFILKKCKLIFKSKDFKKMDFSDRNFFGDNLFDDVFPCVFRYLYGLVLCSK